jgi:formylglycine-generating enzyme required for sulfatase activity
MKKFLLLVVVAMTANCLLANNIAINHVTLTGNNAASQYVMVKFDLAWDNSWRVTSGPSNWDAAWVFIKYRIKSQTVWHHATLHYADGSGSGDGHVLPAGAAIASSNDNGAGGAHGVFVYHNTPVGQGSVSYPGAQLRWDYGVNGVPDIDSVDIRIYAVEMVYVPQGSFSVGSGGAEKNAFYTYPDTTQAYTISSENAIPVGPVNGQLYYHNISGKSGDGLGPIPAAFPKGYKAFYCMKYEITQDQYVAFLSTLNSDGGVGSMVSSAYSVPARNAISGSTRGNVTTSNPYVPCNYISYFSFTAYLDWAALRPLTELEFEKACRGTAAPVRNEFAWGTDGLVNYNPVTQAITTGNPYTLSNAGATNEGIVSNYSNAGNAHWFRTGEVPVLPTNGPLRAGIFAANTGNTGRVTAGASYYGIMELSGNLTEQVVTAGLPDGRVYTGQHGDGQLTAGDAMDVANWPYLTSQGNGLRGGSYLDSYTSLMVSDRSIANARAAAADLFYIGYREVGGRGVRTAP